MASVGITFRCLKCPTCNCPARDRFTVLWPKRGCLVQLIKAQKLSLVQGRGEYEQPRSKRENSIKLTIIDIENKLHSMYEEEVAVAYCESRWQMRNCMHTGRGFLTKGKSQDGIQRRAQSILLRTLIALSDSF